MYVMQQDRNRTLGTSSVQGTDRRRDLHICKLKQKQGTMNLEGVILSSTFVQRNVLGNCQWYQRPLGNSEGQLVSLWPWSEMISQQFALQLSPAEGDQ